MHRPGAVVAQMLRNSAPQIVDAALALQWARWPGMRESFTPDQLAHTREDTAFHVEFLSAAIWAGEQVLFDQYVRWAKALFANLGLPFEWITGSLTDIRDATIEVLGKADAQIAANTIDACLSRFDELEIDLHSYIDPAQPRSGLAMRYLGFLLSGDRASAVNTIVQAAEEGVPVREIYRHVFQPVQLELGRLWQVNNISVAQEHYATAVTQLAMAQLYSYVFDSPHNAGVMVATCVGGELHELGMRMVADYFEMDGWDTHFLGANTPRDAMIDMVADRGADIIGLSATLSSHVPEVGSVIESLRADPRTAEIPIIVGGYPFNLAPDLWQTVGANAYAVDADAAVMAAHGLVDR